MTLYSYLYDLPSASVDERTGERYEYNWLEIDRKALGIHLRGFMRVRRLSFRQCERKTGISKSVLHRIAHFKACSPTLAILLCKEMHLDRYDYRAIFGHVVGSHFFDRHNVESQLELL